MVRSVVLRPPALCVPSLGGTCSYGVSSAARPSLLSVGGLEVTINDVLVLAIAGWLTRYTRAYRYFGYCGIVDLIVDIIVPLISLFLCPALTPSEPGPGLFPPAANRL